MSYTSLQEYKIQRLHRQQKRKQYLNKFEKLKQHLCPSVSTVPVAANVPVHQSAHNEEQLLKDENTRLREEVAEIEKTEKQKIQKYKQQMETAKNSYLSKIKELRDIDINNKQQIQSKITKMGEQLKSATQKNNEISQFNAAVELECNKAGQLMQKYSQELSTEYDQKLQEFNKIFTTSTEKIEAMQQEYNQEEFVESTLQNQDLVNSMKENVEKASEDIDKIIEDYGELLKGKCQILTQLKENNQMKQQEITKMTALEQKLKTICEKLGEEKKIYLDENKKMAEELLEIKELLTKAMASEA